MLNLSSIFVAMKPTTPDYIIWRIDESEAELLSSFRHPEYFAEKIAPLKSGSRRILEVLAVRRALCELCYGEEQQVLYDAEGRPFLSSPFVAPSGEVFPHIAISHTDRYAAVALSPVPVGIDIERRGNRVERVVSHFLKPSEVAVLLLSSDYTLALHLAWSAKEAAFKILGREYYDLQHLTSVVQIDMASSLLLLQVEGRDLPLSVHFTVHDDYVFTWVVDA